MRLAVLSRGAGSYSTRRLLEAARTRGHQACVFDTLKFSIDVSSVAPGLFYRNEAVTGMHAVIPRIGTSVTHFGAAIVRQFEQQGVVCLNGSQAILTARDKLHALQLLAGHGIEVPQTAFVRELEAIGPAIRRLGGVPVVMKLLEGTQGIGVMLAEKREIAESLVEAMMFARQNVIVQRFVSESRGKDVRALVVGGRVIAAMRRTAQGDEFRSNIHRGGMTEPVKLDAVMERTALRATQIVGLRVAGVDMLEGRDGPLVLEVNSTPGLEGIEAATRVDVAGAIVEYLDTLVGLREQPLG